MPYCNYKELLSFREIVFFSRLVTYFDIFYLALCLKKLFRQTKLAVIPGFEKVFIYA